MSRPFGVALLVAGVDKDGPALYCADPSGTSVRAYRCVICLVTLLHYMSSSVPLDHACGYLYRDAQQLAPGRTVSGDLVRHLRQPAEDLALVVLRQVMEEKLNCNNVEMAAIRIGDTK
ncbi:hypothetical protein Emag_004822 [Eimeria magna]